MRKGLQRILALGLVLLLAAAAALGEEAAGLLPAAQTDETFTVVEMAGQKAAFKITKA